MFKKRLNLMIIPSSTGISRQVSIPVTTIYILSGILSVLIIGSFFLSASFLGNRVDEKELNQLKSENSELNKKYEQLRWNLAEIESRYTGLVKQEIKIRSLFNLPEVDEEERLLGIGGPSSSEVKLMTPLEKVAYSSEIEVDRLLNLSRFELEKYEEVETALLKIKKRLNHTPSIWPTKGWLSRGYGMRHDPFTGYRQMHRGMDIANRTGTPVIATADGKVSTLSKSTDLGKLIVINHGFGFKTRYGHLSEIKVKRGQKVKRGDVIGLMGSTGYSTGPHLHYEIIKNGKFYNPSKYILNEK